MSKKVKERPTLPPDTREQTLPLKTIEEQLQESSGVNEFPEATSEASPESDAPTFTEFVEETIGTMAESLGIPPVEAVPEQIPEPPAAGPVEELLVERIPPGFAITEDANIKVDLGFAELIDINGGYVSSRPELDLTAKARAAVKRLSLTLEQREATLSDGSQVRQSVPKAIVWLLERFADSIA